MVSTRGVHSIYFRFTSATHSYGMISTSCTEMLAVIQEKSNFLFGWRSTAVMVSLTMFSYDNHFAMEDIKLGTATKRLPPAKIQEGITNSRPRPSSLFSVPARPKDASRLSSQSLKVSNTRSTEAAQSHPRIMIFHHEGSAPRVHDWLSR